METDKLGIEGQLAEIDAELAEEAERRAALQQKSEALERVVDTHIYNLRKKLEAAGVSGALVNVRGVGYRFRQP